MEEENEKNGGIGEWHKKHREELWAMKNWRAWGSWYSWGSPVGLGLFFVEIGIFVFIIHLVTKS